MMSIELFGVLIIQTLFVIIVIVANRCDCEGVKAVRDILEAQYQARITELKTELVAAQKNVDALRNEARKEKHQ
jgi:hypothetical protein